VPRVHRIPFSTNVERVALAAGHKGVEVEWVDHDPADRSAVRALSGQELVPVMELDGEVIADSTAILARLEHHTPEPPLYPAEPAARARADVFVEWFNRVWKVPPNAIEAELTGPTPPNLERMAALGDEMRAWLRTFEALLADGDFLLGDTLGIADVVAFPFLKHAHLPLTDGDDDVFHRVLVEHQPLGDDHPRLRAWIERVDALPRA
jgi:glutathione S-transferase